MLTPVLLSCTSGSDDTVTLTDKTGSGQTAVTSDSANSGGNSGDDTTAELVDGHDYILNASSKKMHLPSCAFVSRLTDANREESHDSYYTLVEKGYSPCTTCLKTPPQRDDPSDTSSAAASSTVENGDRTSDASDIDLSSDSATSPDSSDSAGTLSGGDENDGTSSGTADSTSASSEKLPDDSLDSSADVPPSEKDTEKDPVAVVKYILNTSTKKFHRPSCSSAAKIAAKNRGESKSTAEELQKQGYSPCKICKPA